MLVIKTARGVSMVEILIALAAGLVLMTASLYLFIGIMKNSNSTLEMARFNHDLQAGMDRIVSDVRRAGYWSQAINDLGTGANTNPFMVTGADIAINVAQDCLLFTYDLNSDGTLPTVNTAGGDKRFGYRLNNSTLQMRPYTAPFSCTAAAGDWNDITDGIVSNVTFTEVDKVVDVDGSGPGTSTITIRDITISITGALPSDNTITRTLTQTVRVRNDKFTP